MGDRKKAEARTREGRGKEQQQQGLDIELPKARFCLRQANSCLLRGRSSCVHFFFFERSASSDFAGGIHH
jgi:hypothetical protein